MKFLFSNPECNNNDNDNPNEPNAKKYCMSFASFVDFSPYVWFLIGVNDYTLI